MRTGAPAGVKRARAERHPTDHTADAAPTPAHGLGARLPLVEVTETEDGTASVRLDGHAVVAGRIDRADLGRMLSALAEQHGPIRVELTDATGRRFFDVLHPPTRPSPFAPPLPPPTPLPHPAIAASTAAGPRLVEVVAAGFVPGEDVEVAAIVLSSSAAPDGTARGLLDLARLPDGARGIVLLGAVSGTITVEYLR